MFLTFIFAVLLP